MKTVLFILGLLQFQLLKAQIPQVFPGERTAETTETTRKYLSPEKIAWQSAKPPGIINPEHLLLRGNGQAVLAGSNMCTLKSTSADHPSLMLDFGRELHGGLQIVTGMYPGNRPVKIRVRFGESYSEAMSDIEPQENATNDHAVRDQVLLIPWLGKIEIGNTGFRFVRIDLLDDNVELQLKEVRAIFIYRDISYLGSFKCSDELLNKIWLTGAYTVHLNMQDFLWDGIKRDRLVWVGDMHPEISTIRTVFGFNTVVPKSLDLSRDITPLPQWMNGISAYSMWWIINHRDWFYHNGDMAYLRQQKDYLIKLLSLLMTKIDSTNGEQLDGRFLDWPSSENPKGVHAGLQAMMVLALSAGDDLCRILNEPAVQAQCHSAIIRLKQHLPDVNKSKQAASLLVMAGMLPAVKTNKEIISVNNVQGFSTFYGYYMLQAKAMAGDYEGALNAIRQYWGAMIKLGATTFWEDFNMDWLPNASRIDEPVRTGQKDIHADYGAYCYKGFRHSLCHGWASGPTPWLTEHILGISVVAPGCKTINITPHLGDLTFAEGSFPTPYGIVKVKHVKQKDGSVKTDIEAPKAIKITRGK